MKPPADRLVRDDHDGGARYLLEIEAEAAVAVIVNFSSVRRPRALHRDRLHPVKRHSDDLQRIGSAGGLFRPSCERLEPGDLSLALLIKHIGDDLRLLQRRAADLLDYLTVSVIAAGPVRAEHPSIHRSHHHERRGDAAKDGGPDQKTYHRL